MKCEKKWNIHEDCLRVIYNNYYKLFVNFTVHTLENYVF